MSLGGELVKLRNLGLVAILLCVAILPAVPAKNATVRLPYDRPALLGYQGPQDCERDLAPASGIVCLEVPPGVNTLAFSVQDASGLWVGGAWYLHGADGAFQGSATYCRGDTLPIPSAVDLIVVRVEGINGPLNCAGSLAGPGTRGIVAIQLR